jgi:branched-chain amino acid transport system substrate-binding protein
MPPRPVGVVLLTTVLAACSSAPAATLRGGADSLYVGVAFSTDSSIDTRGYANGVKLALDKLNATRPRGARPLGVRLPVRGASDVLIAASFRDDPKIVAVVGHTGSAATIAAAPIYADAEHGGRHALLDITPTATNPRVTKTTSWVFRVCPTDDDAARALARYAADSMHAKRIAIIYRDDLFGRGYTVAFTNELATRHMAVVERDPYLRGIAEYDAYAIRLTQRNVDAVVLAAGANEAVDILRAIRRAGSKARFLGSDDLASFNADPASAREFSGLRYTAFYDPQRSGSVTQAFAESYQKTFNLPADQKAALAYDAATLIGEAVFAVGPDRSRVRTWVAHAPQLDGVSGTIRFNGVGGDPVEKPVAIGVVHP